MKFSYKIVLVISSLLLFLSIGNAFINYLTSMQATQDRLKTKSLPLSIDNIYTEVQRHIIEPYLIASMMSTDTFVKAWIMEENPDEIQIKHYLESVKNRYGMLVSFLVSERSGNHYTHNGLLENVNQKKPTNKWYFDFKDISKHHEINIDTNVYTNNTMLMYINFKIFDKDFHFLGATGVGVKVSYIDDMLKMFRNDYNLKVNFVDDDGSIVFGEHYNGESKPNFIERNGLSNIKDQLLSKHSTVLEYKKDNSKYIINSKYIPELNIYLLVEAKLDDFTQETKDVLYMNLAVSLFLTTIIALIIIYITNKYYARLENLADFDTLTQIPNRRSFTRDFNNFLLLNQRNKQPLSMLFIDVDDFKNINDVYGHQVGDTVLIQLAILIKQCIRQTDIYARWGGEEFIVGLIDTKENDAVVIANKIRFAIQNCTKINALVAHSVTISVGTTLMQEDDTLDSILTRADQAMYQAKTEGKNRVHTL